MSEVREISLTKGRELSLEKGLKSLRVSVEWTENNNNSSEDFDIDLMILELNSSGRIMSPDHLVFYNSIEMTEDGKITDPERAVVHSGDDRSGGDGEECVVNLQKVNSQVKEIRFLINIHEALNRRQNFGMIRNAVVRGFEDDKTTTVLVYNLGDSFKEDTVLEVGKLIRRGRAWSFVAVGDGAKESLVDTLTRFGLKIS